jgi:hypothetical protein
MPKTAKAYALSREKLNTLPSHVENIIVENYEPKLEEFHAEFFGEAKDAHTRVTIHTEPKFAYHDLILAKRFGVNVVIAGEQISGRAIQDKGRYVQLLLQYAPNREKFKTHFHKLVEMRSNSFYSDTTRDEAEQLLLQLAEQSPDADDRHIKSLKAYAVKQLSNSYNHVLHFHSPDRNNPNATFEKHNYDESLIEFINEQHDKYGKVIFILNGGMGSGKSSGVLQPAFEYYFQNGLYPHYISARRSLIADKAAHPHHYLNQSKLSQANDSEALYSVINSSFQTRFNNFNQSNKVMILDELEEIRSHLVSGAIGQGTLAERADLLSNFESQLRHADIIISADALTSNSSIDWLKKTTNAKIFVIEPLTPFQYTQKIINYPAVGGQSLALAEIIKKLKNDENVVIFCDASKSNLHELQTAIKSELPSINQILVDGEFVSKPAGKEFLQDINHQLEAYHLCIISPVINSGLSITTKHFSSVFILAAGTIMPTAVIQSMRRFRCVDEIHFAMHNAVANRFTDPKVVFIHELTKHVSPDDFTPDLVSTSENNPYVKKIIDRIVYENELRKNYRNKILRILNQMNFEIVDRRQNSEEKKIGNQIKKRAKDEHKKYCDEYLKNQKGISEKDAHQLFLSREKLSLHQTLDLHGYRIRKLLLIDDITDEIISYRDQRGLDVLEYLILMRLPCSHKNTNQRAKSVLLLQIMKCLSLDPMTFEGEFTNTHAKIVLDYISHGQININGIVIATMPLFYELFKLQLHWKRASQYIEIVLQALGLKMTKTGKKIAGPNNTRNYSFIVERNSTLVQAEAYFRKRYSENLQQQSPSAPQGSPHEAVNNSLHILNDMAPIDTRAIVDLTPDVFNSSSVDTKHLYIENAFLNDLPMQEDPFDIDISIPEMSQSISNNIDFLTYR